SRSASDLGLEGVAGLGHRPGPINATDPPGALRHGAVEPSPPQVTFGRPRSGAPSWAPVDSASLHAAGRIPLRSGAAQATTAGSEIPSITAGMRAPSLPRASRSTTAP